MPDIYIRGVPMTLLKANTNHHKADRNHRRRRPPFIRWVVIVTTLFSAVATNGTERHEQHPTVFLAGDSTMAPKLAKKRPETGWGEALQAKCDPHTLAVYNHARNGRSTRTFIEEGRWQTIVNAAQPGDFVMIQFGHNDASEHKLDRYTPPDQYRNNLRRLVQDVRAIRANPILLTPVMRRRFDERGNFYDTHGRYAHIVREVARTEGVPLVDMHALSGAILLTLGEAQSRELYLILEPGDSENYPEGLDDNTHFSPLGAEMMAKLVVDDLRRQNLPLAALLACETGPRADSKTK